MVQKEEQLVQQKLSAIQDKLGIKDEDFQKTTMFHAQDQRKGMMIMQMQQKTMVPLEEEPKQKLTRANTISAFKKQQDIQMGQMEEMMKDQASMENPHDQE
jgi:hypothetical protein